MPEETKIEPWFLIELMHNLHERKAVPTSEIVRRTKRDKAVIKGYLFDMQLRGVVEDSPAGNRLTSRGERLYKEMLNIALDTALTAKQAFVYAWYNSTRLTKADWKKIYELAPLFAEVSEAAGCTDWSFIRDYPETVEALYEFLFKTKGGKLPNGTTAPQA